MNISVLGSGCVEPVTGACLAEAGNHVLYAQIDAGTVARLNDGVIPVREPGLEPLARRNLPAG